MIISSRKYNPLDYDGFLRQYMEEAYTALKDGNPVKFNCAVSDLTLELKWMVKSSLMAPQIANEIKDYFWRLM